MFSLLLCRLIILLCKLSPLVYSHSSLIDSTVKTGDSDTQSNAPCESGVQTTVLPHYGLLFHCEGLFFLVKRRWTCRPTGTLLLWNSCVSSELRAHIICIIRMLLANTSGPGNCPVLDRKSTTEWQKERNHSTYQGTDHYLIVFYIYSQR